MQVSRAWNDINPCRGDAGPFCGSMTKLVWSCALPTAACAGEPTEEASQPWDGRSVSKLIFSTHLSHNHLVHGKSPASHPRASSSTNTSPRGLSLAGAHCQSTLKLPEACTHTGEGRAWLWHSLEPIFAHRV